MVDSISDMLIRIKNAQAVGKATVDLPFSKNKLALAKILEKNKYIKKQENIKSEKFEFLRIFLKYNPDNSAFIEHIKRVSKPGQRIYKGFRRLQSVRQGYGRRIISTSKGLMTDAEARKKKIGGEVICEIW
ncbi:30S ribosomal protein S8 [bacterium]|nr:30S ribosomal protein S8 [bacterium]|tara:strand:+ start:222 stop:614 length:393 start_codon:yes stop_codon:yes gene_type:complete